MYVPDELVPEPCRRVGPGGTCEARKKPTRLSIGENNRGNPFGNKKMYVPDELVPELCRRIGPGGTRERLTLINRFVRDHPATSLRQVTVKFGEVTTKVAPAGITPPEKINGRAVSFFLRPKFYPVIPEEDRPEQWERHASEDEKLWNNETRQKNEKNDEKKPTKRSKGSESSPRSVQTSRISGPVPDPIQ